MSKEKTTKELKPCPFCGSKDIEVVRPGTSGGSCIVGCMDCHGQLESSEIGYGYFWNIRPREDELECALIDAGVRVALK